VTEEKLKNLLQMADQTAIGPVPASVELSAVRRRARCRHLANIAAPIAAAAVILIAAGIWYIAAGTAETSQQKKIVSLEIQVQQLQARADATLNLVREVLEDQRRQRHLAELEAELARIGDPLQQVRDEIEKTAFVLVYQADRMHNELNQTDSAVDAYNRVIELFPQTRSAKTARQRLSQMQNGLTKRNGSKI
jgi:hypothetical protein